MLRPIVVVMTNLVTFRYSTLEGSVNVNRFITNRAILSIVFTLLIAGRVHAQLPALRSPVPSVGAEKSNDPPPAPIAANPTKSELLKADCGDNQSAEVGNWVTLSGERSTPAGEIGYRWIQVSGPRPKNINEDGGRLMFLPTAEGTYEFALVVAVGNRISVPDFISVAVAGARAGETAELAPAAPLPLDRLAAKCASQLDDPSACAHLAQAFALVSTRMDLHDTYEDVLQGITSCLSPHLPPEGDQRALWEQRLFAPLTSALIREIRPTGLDLSRAESLAQPLSNVQKKSLSDSYRLIAKGLFSSGTPLEKTLTQIPLTHSDAIRGRSSR
jgi:hypothetical protein